MQVLPVTQHSCPQPWVTQHKELQVTSATQPASGSKHTEQTFLRQHCQSLLRRKRGCSGWTNGSSPCHPCILKGNRESREASSLLVRGGGHSLHFQTALLRPWGHTYLPMLLRRRVLSQARTTRIKRSFPDISFLARHQEVGL